MGITKMMDVKVTHLDADVEVGDHHHQPQHNHHGADVTDPDTMPPKAKSMFGYGDRMV